MAAEPVDRACGLGLDVYRYKGQLKASQTERPYPHHIDIIVPPGGLGTRLDAMYDFHAQHGIKPQRRHGTHTADGAGIRWCFADRKMADAFKNSFGSQEELGFAVSEFVEGL